MSYAKKIFYFICYFLYINFLVIISLNFYLLLYL